MNQTFLWASFLFQRKLELALWVWTIKCLRESNFYPVEVMIQLKNVISSLEGFKPSRIFQPPVFNLRFQQ